MSKARREEARAAEHTREVKDKSSSCEGGFGIRQRIFYLLANRNKKDSQIVGISEIKAVVNIKYHIVVSQAESNYRAVIIKKPKYHQGQNAVNSLVFATVQLQTSQRQGHEFILSRI